MLLITLILTLSATLQVSYCDMPKIRLNASRLVARTDLKFLSVALDSHIIKARWKRFNFSNPLIVNLVKGLAPAYLRIGGTAADLVVLGKKRSHQKPKVRPREEFCYCTTSKDESSKICEDLPALYSQGNFSLPRTDWMTINDFVNQTGLTLLFDLNVLLRTPQGRWNTLDAHKLVKMSAEKGFKNIAWELGNEPNSLWSQLGVNISAFQLGRDFHRLRRLLSKFPVFENATIVGPDINEVGNCEDKTSSDLCPAFKFLQQFFLGSKNTLNAVTWHHYYFDGQVANQTSFTNSLLFNQLEYQYSTMANFLKSQNQTKVEIWLGETASAYNGGAFNLSNRYASGLLWLNKLGISAVYNYSVVIRQTLYHGCYALIGEDGQPNPDYWVSYLYKQLVSNYVLNVTGFQFPPTVRIYAHCAKLKSGSGVTLFGINMGNTSFTFGTGTLLEISRFQAYNLEPEKGLLTSRTVLLNGQPLKIIKNVLPRVTSPVLQPAKNITISSFGMAFWVFKDVKLTVCKP